MLKRFYFSLLLLVVLCNAAPAHSWINTPSTQLGAWDATKTNNTVYQAATDGFIMGWANGGGYSGATNVLNVYSDGSNPPTTVRAAAAEVQEGSAGHTTYIIAPIRKGDFYKISIGGSGASVGGIMWLPVGN